MANGNMPSKGLAMKQRRERAATQPEPKIRPHSGLLASKHQKSEANRLSEYKSLFKKTGKNGVQTSSSSSAAMTE